MVYVPVLPYFSFLQTSCLKFKQKHTLTSIRVAQQDQGFLLHTAQELHLITWWLNTLLKGVLRISPKFSSQNRDFKLPSLCLYLYKTDFFKKENRIYNYILTTCCSIWHSLRIHVIVNLSGQEFSTKNNTWFIQTSGQLLFKQYNFKMIVGELTNYQVLVSDSYLPNCCFSNQISPPLCRLPFCFSWTFLVKCL